MSLEAKHIQAPELYGNCWINSRPVSINDLQGKVGLIDFWDYSNYQCIKALPYISEWRKKYKQFGLEIIGVHTPEFEFARSPKNVEKAVKYFDIEYPVMLDNDAIIWNSYGARTLPARCLVDRDGQIRFISYGRGGFVELERAIQQLIMEAGYHGDLPVLTIPMSDEDQSGSLCYKQTNELYLGYLRGAIGNPGGYNPESTIEYKDPGIYIPERFYARGKWKNERQCLRFDGMVGEDGAILVPYQGCDVNAVMSSKNGSVCEVLLHRDSEPIGKKISGEDIVYSGGEVSSVYVDIPRMYQIIRSVDFGSHLIKMTTSNPNLEIYSVTFSTCIIPELISAN
jgi:hypothetical protein